MSKDINHDRLIWGSKYHRLYSGGWYSVVKTLGGQGQCLKIANIGGIVAHPIILFWSKTCGKFVINTLKTEEFL